MKWKQELLGLNDMNKAWHYVLRKSGQRVFRKMRSRVARWKLIGQM
ncbi:hypothetical protein [Paenibacillus aceris]|uniref:Group II intron maturase-specific domain-containing protein n=1 Tax=Paenibacillus aceris TaxID=869555 RepID=A0ABS4HRE8_9BACL|nr:hypothetical protein [Paenibacillus aceris]MBP1961188.1 hypothetical protein [Paenibacillus aceris]NHW38020.1 hypothetical protein [Paenibacillus aceris]